MARDVRRNDSPKYPLLRKVGSGLVTVAVKARLPPANQELALARSSWILPED